MSENKTARPPDFKNAALEWHMKGFAVIPILPGKKRPALTRHPWLDELSAEKIIDHWDKYPRNEVAIIVPAGYVILDADSPKAISALETAEESFNLSPSLTVKTKRGLHHYFRLADDVYAPSDTFDSEKFPGKIDVLGAGRQVLAPPSTDKSFIQNDAEDIHDLTVATQPFIDSIFLLNDRQAPRPPEPDKGERSKTSHGPCDPSKLEALLEQLDPDCSYEEWTRVAMAVFHEAASSEEGLQIFDNWSAKGRKYQGPDAIRAKWRSFRSDVSNPITFGTLIDMAKRTGADVADILQQAEPQFEKCETIVVSSDKEMKVQGKTPFNPLAQFSLTGRSTELEKKFSEEKAILGDLVLSGQLSVWYASPNTGKTLLVLHLLIESIRNGTIDPGKVFYLNMDDTGKGLITKLKLAEEYGFHMLAPGYEGFRAPKFLETIDKMIRQDQAGGTIIILDTLKKFVNLMNKAESSIFSEKLRAFVLKGGTVISLAHTNKNKDGNRSRYAGTSDMVDDSDCVFIIETITEQTDSGRKVIEFVNEKRRGNVPNSCAYCFDNNNITSYLERLLSVDLYNPDKIEALKKAEEKKSDAEIIEAIKKLISSGTNTKMNLAVEAGKQSGISRNSAIYIIEKYSGDKIGEHFWNYTVQDRGRQVFYILDDPITA